MKSMFWGRFVDLTFQNEVLLPKGILDIAEPVWRHTEPEKGATAAAATWVLCVSTPSLDKIPLLTANEIKLRVDYMVESGFDHEGSPINSLAKAGSNGLSISGLTFMPYFKNTALRYDLRDWYSLVSKKHKMIFRPKNGGFVNEAGLITFWFNDVSSLNFFDTQNYNEYY